MSASEVALVSLMRSQAIWNVALRGWVRVFVAMSACRRLRCEWTEGRAYCVGQDWRWWCSWRELAGWNESHLSRYCS